MCWSNSAELSWSSLSTMLSDISDMWSDTLMMYETCYKMNRYQQIGYFIYMARLRQDINDDWSEIDYEIWVSLVSLFEYFSDLLSRPRRVFVRTHTTWKIHGVVVPLFIARR